MINNYKSEKGITLISLVVTIIITIFIASIATYTGLSTVKRTRYFNQVSQLKSMQYEVNDLYQKYKNGDNNILNLRRKYKFFNKN